MKKREYDIEREILSGDNQAKRAKELYQLLTTYNAHNVLLLKARQEYLGNILARIPNCDEQKCFIDQTDYLFSFFGEDECINVTQLLSIHDDKNKIFLLDDDTLLRLSIGEIKMSPTIGLANINYSLDRINRCKGKVFTEDVLHYDPVYYEKKYTPAEAFGLFDGYRQIGPSFAPTDTLRSYDGLDVRDILKPMSIDDISERINEAKQVKERRLTR